MSDTTAELKIRPLNARARAAVRHWVPRLTAVLLLAVLPLAVPPSGPGSWSPGLLALVLLAVAPFLVAYLYVRNASLGLEGPAMVWTGLVGGRHAIPASAITALVARRVTVGPLAVDVVTVSAGGRDVVRLPRTAWNLDALEELAERLRVPVENAVTADGPRPTPGRHRLAG